MMARSSSKPYHPPSGRTSCAKNVSYEELCIFVSSRIFLSFCFKEDMERHVAFELSLLTCLYIYLILSSLPAHKNYCYMYKYIYIYINIMYIIILYYIYILKINQVGEIFPSLLQFTSSGMK